MYVLGSESVVRPPVFHLQEIDLPRVDPDYLQVISKVRFFKKFGECPPLQRVFSPPGKTLRKIAVVLPLHLSNGKDVIPIPFVVDTGFRTVCTWALGR